MTPASRAFGGIAIDEGAVYRDHGAKAARRRICGDLVEVGPEKGLAAGEDDRGRGEAGDVVDDRPAFIEGKLVVVRTGARPRPAMDTVEVAVPGQLPGDQSQRESCRIHRARSLAK
jgi:hypothetical protein